MQATDELTDERAMRRIRRVAYEYETSGLHELCDMLGEHPKPEDQLFNSRNPSIALLHEKPEHRAVVLLKADGYSNVEIANITGYTPEHVSTIVNQPWARKRIIEHQKENIGSTIRDKIEKVGQRALAVLEESLDDDSTPASVKASNAQYLVNRLLGKPSSSLVLDDRRDPNTMTNEELAALITRS